MTGPLFFLAIFLAITAFSAYWIRKGKATEKWPQVDATITESAFTVSMDSERFTNYTPKITYTYHFRGRANTGKGIYFKSKPVFKIETEVKAFLGPYPVGKTVPIRVNPVAPQECVLIAGPHALFTALMAVGAIGSLIMLVILVTKT